jgi:hypothetical protein
VRFGVAVSEARRRGAKSQASRNARAGEGFLLIML